MLVDDENVVLCTVIELYRVYESLQTDIHTYKPYCLNRIRYEKLFIGQHFEGVLTLVDCKGIGSIETIR